MTHSRIHPTAIVSTNARIGDGVIIEPYAIIRDHVEIGDDCVIGAHTVIQEYVRMGARNRIEAHVTLGGLPQDLSFDIHSETWVEIGDDNVLRECVTINRATSTERPTRIGSRNYLMAYTHLGHDCKIGDHVIIANNVGLAGHVEFGDRIVVGGGTMIHQFCRVGSIAMVGGMTPIRKDVMPYTMISADPARHYRLNTVGLRRAGIKGESYRVIEQAFRAIRTGDRALAAFEDTEELEYLRAWLQAPSKRGLSGFA